ncbi:MAG TPA: efflux RND transporter periplasmic adaptor subunit [Vicinamibacterales bacterium]|nr:efflux RND transporter periplasmic adaptor subunit [Vicinamibacterales bacterium]
MNRLMIALLVSLVFTACGGTPTPTPAETTEGADEHEDLGHEGDEGVEGVESTEIHDEMATQSGIETGEVGPARIRETISLHGTIVPDPRRVFRLHARYPGIVRDVRGQIGNHVRKGELLVVVESDESLQRYNIVSPSDGVIVTRDANVGVNTADGPLVTVVDLSTVWVELASFQHDLGKIKPRQPVLVEDVDGHLNANGRVDNVAAVGSAASQSMTVRVVLPNPDGHWRPGLFVTGEVVVHEEEVPLAVKVTGLQDMKGKTVIFEKTGDRYEARPVAIGRRDRNFAELTGGIDAGALYVTVNSYLVKADIEKSGAEHDD